VTFLALIGLGGQETILSQPVAEYVLLTLRAVEIQYNQWLFVSDRTAEEIGEGPWPLMNSVTDSLLVVEVGQDQFFRNIDLDAAHVTPLFKSARPQR